MKGYIPIFMEEDIKWIVPSEDKCAIYIKNHCNFFKKLSIVSIPISIVLFITPLGLLIPLLYFSSSCAQLSKKYLKLIHQSDNPQYIYNCYIVEMTKKLEPILTREKTIDFLNDVGKNTTEDKKNLLR